MRNLPINFDWCSWFFSVLILLSQVQILLIMVYYWIDIIEHVRKVGVSWTHIPLLAIEYEPPKVCFTCYLICYSIYYMLRITKIYDVIPTSKLINTTSEQHDQNFYNCKIITFGLMLRPVQDLKSHAQSLLAWSGTNFEMLISHYARRPMPRPSWLYAHHATTLVAQVLGALCTSAPADCRTQASTVGWCTETNIASHHTKSMVLKKISYAEDKIP